LQCIDSLRENYSRVIFQAPLFTSAPACERVQTLPIARVTAPAERHALPHFARCDAAQKRPQGRRITQRRTIKTQSALFLSAPGSRIVALESAPKRRAAQARRGRHQGSKSAIQKASDDKIYRAICTAASTRAGSRLDVIERAKNISRVVDAELLKRWDFSTIRCSVTPRRAKHCVRRSMDFSTSSDLCAQSRFDAADGNGA
jgi:hypothetical protein